MAVFSVIVIFQLLPPTDSGKTLSKVYLFENFLPEYLKWIF